MQAAMLLIHGHLGTRVPFLVLGVADARAGRHFPNPCLPFHTTQILGFWTGGVLQLDGLVQTSVGILCSIFAKSVRLLVHDNRRVSEGCEFDPRGGLLIHFLRSTCTCPI
ncbi:hypothetical protein DFH08DRAFT_471019 [Mycena albidolilacea]|uniref:Uncharacterized protein n=1 Tax=Mycena albidolilacea TaxID=1033008 RepID=A0AAD7EZY1_9AGAR|nr:hypothetical protein DFH08DRAFT_471019 [Mycena albidolilacea]